MLTGTVVAGTPWYMAPERFRGVPSAPAIDVYALGCVAYACLVGSPPFGGDSFESVLAGHPYEAPPRISDHRADLPAGVDAVLAKAIAKEPADRYPSCGAFAAALHDGIHADAAPSQTTWNPPVPATPAPTIPPPPVPTPVTPTTRRRKIVGATAIVAILVTALVTLAVWTIGAPGQPSATATRLIGTVNAFAIDPAGGVYLSTVSDDYRILKVEPSGTISTIAGSGIRGFSGDGGPAGTAQLAYPDAVAVDRDGNVYIGDRGSRRIRKVDTAGIITTVAAPATGG